MFYESVVHIFGKFFIDFTLCVLNSFRIVSDHLPQSQSQSQPIPSATA